MDRTGIVFNVQRFSIHDGPGIRTTVFLKGCPLSCPWCSNPESRSPSRQLMIRDSKCSGCGECAAACSEGAISLPEGEKRQIGMEEPDFETRAPDRDHVERLTRMVSQKGLLVGVDS
jgi:pyruvate formate lyase activating enzyme